MSGDGKTLLGTLATADMPNTSTYNVTVWDGTNPKTGTKDIGNYLVRWTFNNEVRTWPVVVKVGEAKKTNANVAAALKPGDNLQVDFEQDLDPARFILEGATVSDEQAHGGIKSLKLEKGQQARILIGDQDNLPVRISMWVYDEGKTFGKQFITGGAWGVQTAVGDKFVISQAWRSYLDGDTGYVWFNTGENQFFNPHPIHADRQKGWSQWVFDFTNPQKPLISCNDKEVGTLQPAKYIPATGATALFFLSGDGRAGPIYIDDVSVEYPKP
jgi:hypothetical protein